MMYSFLFLDLTSILCLVAKVCKPTHFFALAAMHRSVDWWWRRSGTAITARCCDSVQTASGWCTSTAAKNLAGYGRPTFCPSPIHQRLRQAQHQRLRAPRGGIHN